MSKKRRFRHKRAFYFLPPPVPAHARFVERRRNDVCVQGEFIYDERRAQVAWSRAGNVLSERYFDSSGRAHGMEVSRFENGSVQWQVPWVRGQLHGLARQFSPYGEELSRSRFVRGVGLDVWIDQGTVSEIRELRESMPHGIERWGHPLYPYEEGHYLRGKRSGVFRRWVQGRLERGYPKYFLDDVEVNRAQYMRACARNSELPNDLRKDDLRERRLHWGFKLVWLRAEVRATLSRRAAPSFRMCGETSGEEARQKAPS